MDKQGIDPRVAEARRLYQAGMGKRAIARQLGVAESTVYTWVGHLRRPQARMSKPEHYAEARQLRAQGLTNVEIGRRLGITRQRVAQLVGPIPRRTLAERQQIIVQVKPGTREKLKRLALALGYTVGRGSEIRQGSVAQLLEAIADGEATVHRPPSESEDT